MLFHHHLCPVDADLICEFITGDAFSSVCVYVFLILQHEFQVLVHVWAQSYLYDVFHILYNSYSVHISKAVYGYINLIWHLEV